jgi:hypothetical protein
LRPGTQCARLRGPCGSRSWRWCFAISAGRAFAQPAAGEEPKQAPKQEPAPDEVPVDEPKPSPTPEVGKDQVKEPIGRLEEDLNASWRSTAGPVKRTPLDWSQPSKAAGFRFGSYGRVLAGSDLRGGKPQKVSVVAHAPRIIEDSYLELELSYGFDKVDNGGLTRRVIVRPVLTLAFDGTLFHDTGEFDAQPALRNMFLDASVTEDLTLWAGSRMYRGDDIYLLDYWPLDDINTVGAGIQYKQRVHIRGGEEKLEGGAHIGFNRLLNDLPVPGGRRPQSGARRDDRRAAQPPAHRDERDARVRRVGRGWRHRRQAQAPRRVPRAARGYARADGRHARVAALRQRLFDRRTGRHVRVLWRPAVPPPHQLLRALRQRPRRIRRARAADLVRSAARDLARERAHVRRVRELGPRVRERDVRRAVASLRRRRHERDRSDDGWEYAIDARPLARVVGDFFVGGDLSYQARFPKGLNPITLRAEDPSVFQIAPMLAWSPMGPSGYDRPQLRFIYRAAHLNQAALDLYVPDDPRHDDNVGALPRRRGRGVVQQQHVPLSSDTAASWLAVSAWGRSRKLEVTDPALGLSGAAGGVTSGMGVAIARVQGDCTMTTLDTIDLVSITGGGASPRPRLVIRGNPELNARQATCMREAQTYKLLRDGWNVTSEDREAACRLDYLRGLSFTVE